jgi:hypothetical protein
MSIGKGHVGTAIAAALLHAVMLTCDLTGQSQPQMCSVKAQFVGSDGAPIRSAFIELRPEGHHDGVRVSGDSNGRVVASTAAGRYDLTIMAAGFNNLSRTITLNRDVDLGRVAMDADPNILHVSGASVCCIDPQDSSPKKDEPKTVAIGSNPVVFRGCIRPASALNSRRLNVQVSCSEQRPTLPQRPPIDMVRVPVDETGHFEVGVPPCFNEMLAHRELRFSLKDEGGATVALLLPKTTAEGYKQSRFGVWLPLETPIPQMSNREAAFYLEFTDNRPLRATITVSASITPAPGPPYLRAVLTNTSDEVLSISSPDFVSDYAWIISDDAGKRVPFRLFMDRTGEPPDRKMPRSRFLFPGDSETAEVNIGLFFNFSSPGTYHVLAKRIVRRPELLGEEQIFSPESTFVISHQKNGRMK